MKDWSALLKANRTKINALAEKNTEYNEKGDVVISRDDPWFYDDVWDDDYKELIAFESDSPTRSLVR